MKPELSSATVFPALGMGSDVKAYLRSKHPVKNRNISKRDLDTLIHGILSTRDYQPVVLHCGAPDLYMWPYVWHVCVPCDVRAARMPRSQWRLMVPCAAQAFERRIGARGAGKGAMSSGNVSFDEHVFEFIKAKVG